MVLHFDSSLPTSSGLNIPPTIHDININFRHSLILSLWSSSSMERSRYAKGFIDINILRDEIGMWWLDSMQPNHYFHLQPACIDQTATITVTKAGPWVWSWRCLFCTNNLLVHKPIWMPELVVYAKGVRWQHSPSSFLNLPNKGMMTYLVPSSHKSIALYLSKPFKSTKKTSCPLKDPPWATQQ